jgi:hypothetical protein
MTNSKEIPIKIGQETISYEEDYIYLGQVITFHNNSNKEIKRQISIAWKRF